MTIDVIALTTGIDRPQHNVVPCFACGATFIYRDRRGELNGRFCSTRYQAAYDAGYTPPGEQSTDTLAGWKIVAGGELGADYYACMLGRTPIAMKRTAPGFKIACAGCQKDRESLGLRCCSDACEGVIASARTSLSWLTSAPSPARSTTVPRQAAQPRFRNGARVARSRARPGSHPMSTWGQHQRSRPMSCTSGFSPNCGHPKRLLPVRLGANTRRQPFSSKANTRFQSSFMLMTVQFFFFASS
jgi:hypothetical protein